MVDDHTRVAYSEVLDSEDFGVSAQLMLRAAQWFATLRYRIERVMTDNAWVYRKSNTFEAVLEEMGAAHKRTRPH